MLDEQIRCLMLIDLEASAASLASLLAARAGWHTLTWNRSFASPAQQGLSSIDAILVDVNASSGGVDVVRELRPTMKQASIVALCADVAQAMGAIRAGASDFLLKPLLPESITAALRGAAISNSHGVAPLSQKLPLPIGFDEMAGAAPVFRAALAVASRAAVGQRHLLVAGESGTGKETLIRAMIGTGPRARQPMRIINVGLKPASAIESLLFGHEKDAFPGAFASSTGAIRECDGGTIVIDEIEYLPLRLQDRLMQFMSDGAVRPVGARQAIPADVRVIASSNVRLENLAEDDRVMPKLLRTLSPALVELPPLRQREGDVPPLVQHFLTRFAAMPGVGPVGIDDAALAFLARCAWPGNIRQLEAVLLRAALTCKNGRLLKEDFERLGKLSQRPMSATVSRPSPEPGVVMLYTGDGNLRTLGDIESDVIRLAVQHYRGRLTHVARHLKIGRSTLYRKLGELGMIDAA